MAHAHVGMADNKGDNCFHYAARASTAQIIQVRQLSCNGHSRCECRRVDIWRVVRYSDINPRV